MKKISPKFVIGVVIMLLSFAVVDFVQAQQDLFPWVRFNGSFQTTAGIGTGSFILNGIVSEMDYENGDVWTANVSGVETIHGAKVTLNSAFRTGDYSFNGNGVDPVTLTIKTADGVHTFLEATLTDVTFQCGTASPVTCWLNEGLDANNPATLNLVNINLSTNDGPSGPGSGPYPSRYIDELRAYLAASNVSGMKMSVLVPPVSIFNFTTNSSGPITYGLIDGLQSLNAPPVADAGATTSQSTCLSTSCVITLDGSQSTDPDGIADIVSYEWFENSVLIATGVTAPVTLSLGMHDITLRVTDMAGESSEATITVVIDPAELSFIEIDKAHVKDKGKIKIYGRLALPAGLSQFDVNSVGSATVRLSDPLITVISESVDFIERANGNKWAYESSAVTGLNSFKIDWSGAKFSYQNGPLSIKTRHIGEDKTSLEITSCSPVSVDINGTVVTIDENDVVTSSSPGTKIDGDDDGDSDDEDDDHGNTTDDDGDCTARVKLPFALTSDMVINISGSVTDSITVGGYMTAAVGKFVIEGKFDGSAINFSSLVPNLQLTVTLGNEGFNGTLVIDQATWTKITSKGWKYNDK